MFNIEPGKACLLTIIFRIYVELAGSIVFGNLCGPSKEADGLDRQTYYRMVANNHSQASYVKLDIKLSYDLNHLVYPISLYYIYIYTINQSIV